MKQTVKLLPLAFLLVLHSHFSFGQWLPLPHCQSGNSGGIYGDPPLGYPHPAADQVILYSNHVLLMHGEKEYIYRSVDDNKSNSLRVQFGGSYINAGVLALVSQNDSVHAFVAMEKGLPHLIYTSTNFTSLDTLDNSFWGFNTQLALRPNLLYMAMLVGTNKDNISIIRYSILPKTKTTLGILPYSGVTQMSFLNDSTGYILCQKPHSILYKTVDYGNTWTSIATSSTQIISGFSFPSLMTGFYSSLDGTIHKTTDGGLTWTQLPFTAARPLNTVTFVNDFLGYAAGKDGYLIKTKDTGTSWTIEASGDTNTINSIYMFGTVAYFIDTLQHLFKNENTLGITPYSQTSSVSKLFPNPTNGLFRIEFKTDDLFTKEMLFQAHLEIRNTLGQRVFVTYKLSSETDIVLESAHPGVYYYRLLTEDNRLVGAGKFVVN